ncbi:hypothetical protein FOA52_011440 [Chlamydomonas sp. UWO 241]|nr:hypothetical protein FOA52_011440 [Chlamydomonas sp. UWO 241]
MPAWAQLEVGVGGFPTCQHGTAWQHAHNPSTSAPAIEPHTPATTAEVLVPSGRVRSSRGASSSGRAAPPAQEGLHEAASIRLTREEEAACCHILQEARRLRTLHARLTASQRRRPSAAELARAADLPDASHVRTALASAPAARRALVLASKAYIAALIRRLVAADRGLSFGAGGGASGGPVALRRSVPVDDMFLAGVCGLIDGAYAFDTTRAGHAPRLLTYAHHHILKALSGAVRDRVYSDLYIPRRTLELKGAVERAAAAEADADQRAGRSPMSSRGGGGGSGGSSDSGGSKGGGGGGDTRIARIAVRLGVAASAVDAALSVSDGRCRVALTSGDDGDDDDGGGGSVTFEDVQLDKAAGRRTGGAGVGADGDETAGGGAQRRDAQSVAARDVALAALHALLLRAMSRREAFVLCRSLGLAPPALLDGGGGGGAMRGGSSGAARCSSSGAARGSSGAARGAARGGSSGAAPIPSAVGSDGGSSSGGGGAARGGSSGAAPIPSAVGRSGGGGGSGEGAGRAQRLLLEPPPVSSYQLAGEVGVSRQRVDAIQKRALERLRAAVAGEPEMAGALGEACKELAAAL